MFIFIFLSIMKKSSYLFRAISPLDTDNDILTTRGEQYY